MGRLDVNRTGEMEVFVRVIALGGFSAAARALRMSPSAVSKLIGRLEGRLGVRLINRSTRKLQITAEGAAFYDQSVRILADIETAEREATQGATPQGRLRINSNVPFGLHHLMRLLPTFLEQHPQIIVDVSLTDTVVDLLQERADIAIRAGPLRESALTARKLGETRLAVVASPAWIEKNGTPRTPADLAGLNQLRFGFTRLQESWPFRDPRTGAAVFAPPTGDALLDSGEAMRQLCLAGGGLARHALWHVGDDIRAGRLVAVLEDWNPGDTEAVHAIFLGQGGHLPARVRAFLDYLAASVRF